MIERGPVVRHDLAIRPVTVTRVARASAGMARITVTGDFAGFTSVGPTDHVKVFFPDAAGTLHAPILGPNGISRPEGVELTVRDYTPRAFRELEQELDLDFVLHGDDGPASRWAANAAVGSQLTVAGPRGSRLVPTGIRRAVLAADESALPALARWIELLPDDVEILALVATQDAGDHAYLEPAHVNRARVTWFTSFDGIEKSVRDLGVLDDTTFVWAAGEATALIPLRRYLRRELGLPKEQVEIDGYWKRGIAELDHHAPLDPTDPDD